MLDFIRDRAKSFSVKLIFGIIIVVFVFWGVGNIDSSSTGALAVVNGENITIQDFNKLFRREVQELKKAAPDILNDPAQLRELKQQVLARIITSRLRRQEATRLGLTITPHELKLVLAGFAVFQNAEGKFDPEAYKRVLASQEISQGEFEADYSKNLLEEKLLRDIVMSVDVSEMEARTIYSFSLEKRKAEYVFFSAADYTKNVAISDEEINQHYTENKDSFKKPEMLNLEFLRLTAESLASGYPVSDQEVEDYYAKNKLRFFQPESFQARHIFIACPPDDAETSGVKEKVRQARSAIEEIAAQLVKGENFAAIAAARSEDKESAVEGGMLGWLHKGQLGSDVFDDAALRLAPGEISKPVRSEVGFHIIKLEGKKNAFTPPLTDVRQEIVAVIAQEKADEDFKNVEKAAEDGLAMHVSFADLARQFRVEVTTTGLLPQNEAEAKLSLHKDSRQILKDAIHDFTTASAGQGTTSSSSMTVPTPLSIDGGIALIRIVEAKPAFIPPLDDVRDTIAEQVRFRKAMTMARATADDALPLFAGKEAPKKYKEKLKESGPAVRLFPEVSPLGLMPELVNGLFASSGEWLPEVFTGADGFFIARTKTVESVSEEDWQQVKDIFMSQLKQRRQKEALDSFIQKVLESAKIEESANTLERLSLR
ncbi:MAG: SurA N-terminal domain-containing protein [Desulfovibrio sp.]|jgi:peptidyl-prolyl cis-trans isomerase D|nr:SurA N-terminal domain-containing protein [Desulfovibrio sp.]